MRVAVAFEAEDLVETLFAEAVAARKRVADDPFGNPVLDMALRLSRALDEGELALGDLAEAIRGLRDGAFAERAARLGAYVGGTDEQLSLEAMQALAKRLAGGTFLDFSRAVGRNRFTAVFTAHPTFSMPYEVGNALAMVASGRDAKSGFASHRPTKPTLLQEFAQAVKAITAGRDAIDDLSAALLAAARERWPQDWTKLTPKPVTLASWVGYDTDGRTDVNWWDSFSIRLEMKALQLRRLAAQVADIGAARRLHERLSTALAAVEAQGAACPSGEAAKPAAVAAFAKALIDRREEALVSARQLEPLFAEAFAAVDDDEDDRMALAVARSGLESHGLALAHSQFRLNASQLHNALRQLAGVENGVGDPARRRAMLSAVNGALDRLEPSAVDFGALNSESSSAVRLFMTLAQIVKHVDADTPIRLHIAETESGFTLLCALWLAKLCGVEDKVQISPLFETAEALEHGYRVVDEALRSRHWRAYLEKTGVLALEFGYSDSGRYVGQLAASYMIERQRLKIAETLANHGVNGVEVIFFDTHGESIGRGAHPGSLEDRLKFLSPTRSRKDLMRAGVAVREESAFQGGDGYLLFGTRELALASVARIAEHVFDPDARPDARRLPPDPVYDDPDFSADFFGAIRAAMQNLVDDPGYAALLGAFGPALLDPTGSRPSVRQVDGLGGPAAIRHPRELRAIPNNAILQQLGWCANTLHGVGAALERNPQAFQELIATSPRFRRAIDFVAHGLAHSDLHVLRAVLGLLDPGSWLNAAELSPTPEARKEFTAISAALEGLGLSSVAFAMLRKIQTDNLALRAVWPEAPRMRVEEQLLHAIRLALVQRIWRLAIRIPTFSPRFGVTHQAVTARLLRLDVPATLDVLATIFPAEPDAAADLDYHEPRGLRTAGGYEREHREIFEPIAETFALVREVSTAVSHSVGAFG